MYLCLLCVLSLLNVAVGKFIGVDQHTNQSSLDNTSDFQQINYGLDRLGAKFEDGANDWQDSQNNFGAGFEGTFQHDSEEDLQEDPKEDFKINCVEDFVDDLEEGSKDPRVGALKDDDLDRVITEALEGRNATPESDGKPYKHPEVVGFSLVVGVLALVLVGWSIYKYCILPNFQDNENEPNFCAIKLSELSE